MLKKNKMEKFKVKMNGRWISKLTLPVETCTNEDNAKIFEHADPSEVKLFIDQSYDVKVVEFIPIPTEKQPESKPKELDLCEILKDAPMGLKLWSVIYGDVKLECVMSGNGNYPIRFSINETLNSVTTSNGYYDAKHPGECTLFPSKDNRDWSTFKLPYKLPVKGELCWTMSSVGNWVLRFAIGEVDQNKAPLFCPDQTQKGDPFHYQWQPLSEIPEVLKSHLKLK